ncbi:PIN domain-containing protein [Brevifollis gellanilyticus]|uniref:PIN domain-containing protein n=1 Tax=Brevifollis gellanilyticus TaxID=748831 RepID=UPI0011BDD770
MQFWDTSGLLSLVLKDGHYRKACQWLMSAREPHITSSLVVFEAENRLHALQMDLVLSRDDYSQCLTALRLLVSSRLIAERHLRNTRSLSAECRRLITVTSPHVVHSSMDVLHVASALVLRAGCFRTFDRKQNSLAGAAGLAAS